MAGIFTQHFLENSARRTPAKVALVCEGRELSYGEINALADSLAAEMVNCGLQRGERVTLWLPNTVQMVVGIFAVLKAGAVFVPVSPSTRTDKLTFILNQCGASGLFMDRRLRNMPPCEVLREAAPRLKFIMDAGGLNGARTVPGLGRAQEPVPDTGSQGVAVVGDDTDLACLIYTSGTTGTPKGVMCHHGGMVFATKAIGDYLENNDQDVILNVLPLAFSYGIYQLMATFNTGGCLVLEKSFTFPNMVLQRLQETRATGFAGVPTIYNLLLAMDLSAYDLSSLRYLTNAAAGLPADHVLAVKKRFPQARFYSMYGQTEVVRTLYLPPDQIMRRPDSVGIPIPGTEAWIEDEEGCKVSPGQTGELIVRGRHVMRGYWDASEASAARFQPGGHAGERVFRSGDLFRQDEEGYFYFVSRKDDIIKCRGEKVAPKEIENALMKLAGVREAAVVGVPDPILGQAIKAVLVVGDSPVTAAQVRAHCRACLEELLVPKHVEFREELPRTINGKVKRSELAGTPL
jgi:amino acid adenylation domain-containing protein